MNTAALKRFAQQARVILKEGVEAQLQYWGFDAQGRIMEEPVPIEGGVMFRGEVVDDPALFKKWDVLKNAVKVHGFRHVAEEAAYTWFNRLMAIRILAKNGYIRPQLEFESENIRTPLIVGNARRGQLPPLTKEERIRFDFLIADDSAETEQFGLLITAFCRTHTLLNRVFGRLDDYTALLLPHNMLAGNGFIDLLNSDDFISDDDYRQVELIGWLYQFYISEKKDEVFKSFKNKKKAEAEDIPAATQIFTPNWIVKYMVQNTVGRLWLDLNPDSRLKNSMEYLVENPDAKEPTPVISDVSEIKLLDPACGSGHILVEGFDLLFNMYIEDGYTKRKATRSILQQNLYGLDIDLRAVQLANFALLLKAAAKDPAILEEDITPQIYAMPEPHSFDRLCIQTFLGEDVQYADTLQKTLTLMQQAQNLGSVMKISISPEMRACLEKQLVYWQKRKNTLTDVFLQEELDHIFDYIRIILMLTQQYEAVAANPPYMGSGNMNAALKEYVAKYYPEGKSDLMTVFMNVISNLTLVKGRYAMINLPSWLFLSTFQKLREDILENYHVESLLHFGRGIFGIDFGSVAFAIKKQKFNNMTGTYFRLHERNFQHIYYQDIEKLFLYAKNNQDYKYDFSLYRDVDGINQIPSKSVDTGVKISYKNVLQSNFKKIPKKRLGYWVKDKLLNVFSNSKEFSSIAFSDGKNVTGDNNKFLRHIWETNNNNIGINRKWMLMTKGGDFRKYYGNTINLIDWSKEARLFYRKSKVGRLIPEYLWYLNGITWSKIASKGSSFRLLQNDCTFDEVNITFNDDIYIPLFLSFLNSKVPNEIFKIFNPTFSLQTENVLELPITEELLEKHNSKLFNKQIEISKLDWDSRETSWDFQENELIRQQKPTLAEAYQKYHTFWTQQFAQLHNNEVELNRIFIDIYGLQEELTPEVKLKDITILQEELDYNVLGDLTEMEQLPDPSHIPLKADEVMRQFISYAVGCMMGRYRLDRPGLHIAHPHPSEEETAAYEYNGAPFQIDEDGIIPLMDASSSFPDNTLLRLKAFIRQVWGNETEIDNINFMESALGKDLETYLMKDFWKDHCRRYQKRPVYWLFASSKGAFRVLAYMHRMNKYTVEKIRSNYLLKHIQNLESRRALLDAEAATLDRNGQRTLEKIIKDIDECRAYDLYLKDVADNQVEFDLDDGVVVNYAKFGNVVADIK